MYASSQPLKSISTISLTADEAKLLKWIRSAKWEAVADAREPIPYKAKVPEFFGGVRLYKMHAGPVTGAGAMGALDVFIKKIEFQGIISKQDMYPVVTQGNARFLMLKKADIENLGVGADEDDD